MLRKLWEKCVNYETVSYIICGFLTTAVDFAKEVGAFVAARAFSGAVTWVLMVVMVKLGGDRGMLYELFCKFTSSVINMVLNYIFSKLWIFKNKPE